MKNFMKFAPAVLTLTNTSILMKMYASHNTSPITLILFCITAAVTLFVYIKSGAIHGVAAVAGVVWRISGTIASVLTILTAWMIGLSAIIQVVLTVGSAMVMAAVVLGFAYALPVVCIPLWNSLVGNTEQKTDEDVVDMAA